MRIMRLQLLPIHLIHMPLEVHVMRSQFTHHWSYIFTHYRERINTIMYQFVYCSVFRRRCWWAPSSTATWENVLYPSQIKSGDFRQCCSAFDWDPEIRSLQTIFRLALYCLHPQPLWITVMSETDRSMRMDNELSRFGGLLLGKHPAHDHLVC